MAKYITKWAIQVIVFNLKIYILDKLKIIENKEINIFMKIYLNI